MDENKDFRFSRLPLPETSQTLGGAGNEVYTVDTFRNWVQSFFYKCSSEFDNDTSVQTIERIDEFVNSLITSKEKQDLMLALTFFMKLSPESRVKMKQFPWVKELFILEVVKIKSTDTAAMVPPYITAKQLEHFTGLFDEHMKTVENLQNP